MTEPTVGEGVAPQWRLRVIHIGRYIVPPWVEGVTNTVEALARFTDQGVESRIITIIHADDEGTYPDRTIVRSRFGRNSEKGPLFDLKARSEDARLARRIAQEIEALHTSTPVDVIHVHNFSHTALRVALRRFLRLNKNVALIASHYGESGSRLKALQRYGARIAARGFDLHVCTSQRSALRLQRVGVGPRRIRIVPPPAELSMFARTPRVQTDSATIGYLGNLSEARFPTATLEALMTAVQGSPVTVSIVTSTRSVNDDWVAAAHKRWSQGGQLQIRRKNLSVEEKAAFLARTDVFILPFAEPSAIDPPVTLVEAMAAGCVCVVTSVQASPDLAEDMRTAIVVDAGPEAFAAAALNAAKDTARFSHIAAAAKKGVTHRFAIETVGAELRAAYDGALKVIRNGK